MTLNEFKKLIGDVVQDKLGGEVDLQKLDVSRAADPKHGDIATNAAMVYAKDAGRVPRELAEELAAELSERLRGQAEKVVVAGPGFINITLSASAFAEQVLGAVKTKPQDYAGQTVVAEYSDPNPFKVLHAGHVYTTVVGDAIARLLEAGGAKVHRVNFGGDVGLHVGKTMWAILRELGGENPDKLAGTPTPHAEWLAKNYIIGNAAYEDDEVAKMQITELNKRVYQIHTDDDHDSSFARIYWTCREWSYEAFDAFYARMGTKVEKYYPESETSGPGLKAVKAHIGPVFEKSDGAVVFKGESYGLHTRVFINRQGLPTYEAKDVGLIIKKYEDYHFDRSVIVTANEQQEYMAVVLKAIEQFLPDLAHATTYISHGMLKLVGGEKMSSRKGNIIRATAVLDETAEAIVAAGRKADDAVVLGAIRYAFLKSRIGGDIIYNPAESISLEGNSGPYLQYAHARARSILAKVKGKPAEQLEQFDAAEHTLGRKIAEYPDVLQQAVDELMPHFVCTYLYELAQTFNRFYEVSRVVRDPRQDIRLKLVELYADVLRDGISLLGIVAPDRL